MPAAPAARVTVPCIMSSVSMMATALSQSSRANALGFSEEETTVRPFATSTASAPAGPPALRLLPDAAEAIVLGV
jgi:hypothetical protein